MHENSTSLKKVARDALRDFLVVFLATSVLVPVLALLLEGSDEGNMTGWLESYVLVVAVRSVAMFAFDKDVRVVQKIIGVVAVTLASLALIQLWTAYSPRSVTLSGLLYGFPLPLLLSKALYKLIVKGSPVAS